MFIIKDLHPQVKIDCYFVGTRKVKDPQGNVCEAADFGPIDSAKRFSSKNEANAISETLNKIANRKQFTVESIDIFSQKYGQKKRGGFSGFKTMQPVENSTVKAGFNWVNDNADGYNGF